MTHHPSWSLQLLGSWQLTRDGEPVRVTIRQQRLISVLALNGPRPRSVLAGLLWPESREIHAMTSLRVTLWHISHELPGLIRSVQDPLSLSPDVAIDVRAIEQCADGVAGSTPAPVLLEHLSRAELLPGWYDDWVAYEQERMCHVRLAALDGLARRELAAGHPAAAESAALLAVNLEPLRESSNVLLIAAQLACGDHNAAGRASVLYRERSLEAFGIEPALDYAGLALLAQREPVMSR